MPRHGAEIDLNITPLREVGTYRLAYEQSRAAALGPQDSAELISRLAGELPPP